VQGPVLWKKKERQRKKEKIKVSKVSQMRLHQVKRLLHSKGNNYWSERESYRMEKIFASFSSIRGLTPRICKEVNQILKCQPNK
jgi:hypothetical protein